jgi:hypothetical protein
MMKKRSYGFSGEDARVNEIKPPRLAAKSRDVQAFMNGRRPVPPL